MPTFFQRAYVVALCERVVLIYWAPFEYFVQQTHAKQILWSISLESHTGKRINKNLELTTGYGRAIDEILAVSGNAFGEQMSPREID